MLFLALALACPRSDAPPDPIDPPDAGAAVPDAHPHDWPATAQAELALQMRADAEAARSPADGAGSAGIVDGPDPVEASALGSWTLVFEAGPLGVVEGGAVFLQISPFWGWSPLQIQSPAAPGYATVEVGEGVEGISLAPQVVAEGLLAVTIGGRALSAGETLRFSYAGRADMYAEREARFWFAVDGDGDGIREVLRDSPGIEVTAGPPAQLILTLPTTAAPGASIDLVAAALDRAGNAGVEVAGPLELVGTPGLSTPSAIPLADGLARISLEAPSAPGIYRVVGRIPGGAGEVLAESNPLVVGAAGARVIWADLHGHSNLSDGTGTPEDYLAYARDVAALDAVSLTDHDHWGMAPLSRSPEWWARIQAATAAANEPGRFVALLGYEWTSWIYGHRHVLFFGDTEPAPGICDSATAGCERPEQLWDQLRGQPALTFAHHQSGGPVATDWSIPPDPELEPVTEIASVHGSSEAADAPKRIYGWVEGNDVRSALDRGYRLGLIGSGDSHDGHPGLPHLNTASGGLAAILTDDLTPEGVRAALKARRAYATNGPRILLRATLAGRGMGAAMPAAEVDGPLIALAVAPGALERIDLIRDGAVVATEACGGERSCRGSWSIEAPAPGYLYVRAVQIDGGAAWSSPFFLD